MTLQTPDFEHWVTEGTFDFFTLGLAPIFGWSHGLFEFYRVTNMDLVTDDNVTFQLAPEITTPFREVSVQGFLSDRVIRARGTLVSRADLLKFICYHDFGVHFSGREEPVFTLIRRFRNMVTFFNAPGGVLGIAVSDHFDASLQRETLIDLAHAHTLSTGYYLATSADVVRLKVLIEAEMASAYPPAEDRPH